MAKFGNNPSAGPPGWHDWLIAVDGGTTNTRARLLHGARLVATARRAVGVRDAVLRDPSGTPSRPGPPDRGALLRAVGEAVAEARVAAGEVGIRPAVVAAGMLSSEVGLRAVPHVEAPSGLDELARASAFIELPEVDDRPVLVVPGVRTPASDGPDGWFDADVMRGEECETLGGLAAMLADGRLEPGEPSLFLWPGSHTKLVAVDADGRIARSFTTLAGEALQAIAHHTLLAASLPADWPVELDRDAAAAGARAAARHGIGRAAFLVRIAALGGCLDDRGRAAFWIGAAVEADAIDLARHPLLSSGLAVHVGGRDPLRALYAEAIARRYDGPVLPLDPDLAEVASALGALAVADRRHLLDGGLA